METIGEEFNADLHEAVTEIPAPTKDLIGKVVDEILKGYSPRAGDTVWQGEYRQDAGDFEGSGIVGARSKEQGARSKGKRDCLEMDFSNFQ